MSIWWTKWWQVGAGCTKCSSGGCASCWAINYCWRMCHSPNKKLSSRYENLTKKVDGELRWTGDVRTFSDKLEEPLHWRKPQRVFVAPCMDLFHESVPDEFIDKVFAVMALCPQHIFKVLTKRPERMLEYFDEVTATDQCACDLVKRWGCAAGTFLDGDWIWNKGKRFRKKIEAFISATHGFYPDNINILEEDTFSIPLENVWLGVSCEDQKTADERIPLLLHTPAQVRFVSVEPMLESVDIAKYMCSELHDPALDCKYHEPDGGLDWVVCGTESGPRRRICHIDNIRSVRDQCVAAEVPFFLKQIEIDGKLVKMPELDGKVWAKMPGDCI